MKSDFNGGVVLGFCLGISAILAIMIILKVSTSDAPETILSFEDLLSRWLTLLVATFGLVFISGTLRETATAANAAVAMNRLTEANQSPKIGISMQEENLPLDGQMYPNGYIKFKITNMGLSPAKITEVKRCWSAMPDLHIPPAPSTIHDSPGKKIERYIAGISETEEIIANPGSVAKIDRPLERLFFQGWIR